MQKYHVKIYVSAKTTTNLEVFFYGLFLAPKIEFCSTIDDIGIIQQQMAFKGFNDSK